MEARTDMGHDGAALGMISFGDMMSSLASLMDVPTDACIDEAATFKPEAVAALKDYKSARPWFGGVEGESFNSWTERRFGLFVQLLSGLNQAYEMDISLDKSDIVQGGCSDISYIDREQNKIVMQGKLSIITLLHLFGLARFSDRRKAVHFSINLHRKVFKRLWDEGKLQVQPGTYIVRWVG